MSKPPPLPGEPGYNPQRMTVDASHKAAKRRRKRRLDTGDIVVTGPAAYAGPDDSCATAQKAQVHQCA